MLSIEGLHWKSIIKGHQSITQLLELTTDTETVPQTNAHNMLGRQILLTSFDRFGERKALN